MLHLLLLKNFLNVKIWTFLWSISSEKTAVFQVFYHNFVNELVKNLIVYHEQIFPTMLPGPRYEKYLIESEQALFIDEQ